MEKKTQQNSACRRIKSPGPISPVELAGIPARLGTPKQALTAVCLCATLPFLLPLTPSVLPPLPPPPTAPRGDDWAAVAAALRQLPRSSSGPYTATSTTRYAHPLSRLPAVQTNHPNPNLLFVFGSDLIASVFECIMTTKFDCFAKNIG